MNLDNTNELYESQVQVKIVLPQKAIEKIEPGMSIFIGTGVSEPRTLLKYLMDNESANLQDLELIQLISLGDIISTNKLRSQKYRLKTFSSGWISGEAIREGLVDLIPCRYSQIPQAIASGGIPIDAAFFQISPPNASGYGTLGVTVDVTNQVLERASIIVGEINSDIPRTLGDTFIHVSEFDFLVESKEEPLYFDRFPVDDVFEVVAENIASIIEDGSCLAFFIGPLFDALVKHLTLKRNLGIHTPVITDAVMDLIKSGAVTNRKKEIFRGTSTTSYAFGTKNLMKWLDQNPLVNFQGIDKVFSPVQIGRNSRFVGIFQAEKVSLSGGIVLRGDKKNLASSYIELLDFFNGAELSIGGATVFGLPSRDQNGESNIVLSLEEYSNQFGVKESVDVIATEYGIANLKWRTIRERAQAIIEIAHPEDREKLLEKAKTEKLLYPDQIFMVESAHFYPMDTEAEHIFNNNKIRFRAIKPSDEEEMRKFFYRFSDESIYLRYFSFIKVMPHSKMQKYVNIDPTKVISIIGLIGEHGQGRIIAEARFIRDPIKPYGDVAFFVDEKYQGIGIASFLFNMLVTLAKERGLIGFTADVLVSNRRMLKVFEKSGMPIVSKMESGVSHITMNFYNKESPERRSGKASDQRTDDRSGSDSQGFHQKMRDPSV